MAKEYKLCPDCNNGYTSAMVRLHSIVFYLLMSGEDASRGKNHPYFDYMDKNLGGNWKVADKQLVELTTALAGRKPYFGGYDVIDRSTTAKKIIKAAGLDPETWGICTTCKGEGEIKIKK